MAPKPSKEFEEFQKQCKFKTYWDSKCVNEQNKAFRKVGSCSVKLCPLFKKTS